MLFASSSALPLLDPAEINQILALKVKVENIITTLESLLKDLRRHAGLLNWSNKYMTQIHNNLPVLVSSLLAIIPQESRRSSQLDPRVKKSIAQASQDIAIICMWALKAAPVFIPEGSPAVNIDGYKFKELAEGFQGLWNSVSDTPVATEQQSQTFMDLLEEAKDLVGEDKFAFNGSSTWFFHLKTHIERRLSSAEGGAEEGQDNKFTTALEMLDHAGNINNLINNACRWNFLCNIPSHLMQIALNIVYLREPSVWRIERNDPTEVRPAFKDPRLWNNLAVCLSFIMLVSTHLSQQRLYASDFRELSRRECKFIIGLVIVLSAGLFPYMNDKWLKMCPTPVGGGSASAGLYNRIFMVNIGLFLKGLIDLVVFGVVYEDVKQSVASLSCQDLIELLYRNSENLSFKERIKRVYLKSSQLKAVDFPRPTRMLSGLLKILPMCCAILKQAGAGCPGVWSRLSQSGVKILLKAPHLTVCPSFIDSIMQAVVHSYSMQPFSGVLPGLLSSGLSALQDESHPYNKQINVVLLWVFLVAAMIMTIMDRWIVDESDPTSALANTSFSIMIILAIHQLAVIGGKSQPDIPWKLLAVLSVLVSGDDPVGVLPPPSEPRRPPLDSDATSDLVCATDTRRLNTSFTETQSPRSPRSPLSPAAAPGNEGRGQLQSEFRGSRLLDQGGSAAPPALEPGSGIYTPGGTAPGVYRAYAGTPPQPTLDDSGYGVYTPGGTAPGVYTDLTHANFSPESSSPNSSSFRSTCDNLAPCGSGP